MKLVVESWPLFGMMICFMVGTIWASVEFTQTLHQQHQFHDTNCLVKNMTWNDGSTFANYSVQVDQVMETVVSEKLYHVGSTFRCWYNKQTHQVSTQGLFHAIMTAQVGIILCSLLFVFTGCCLCYLFYMDRPSRKTPLAMQELLSRTL